MPISQIKHSNFITWHYLLVKSYRQNFDSTQKVTRCRTNHIQNLGRKSLTCSQLMLLCSIWSVKLGLASYSTQLCKRWLTSALLHSETSAWTLPYTWSDERTSCCVVIVGISFHFLNLENQFCFVNKSAVWNTRGTMSVHFINNIFWSCWALFCV